MTGDKTLASRVTSNNKIQLKFATKDFVGEFFHYTGDLFLIYRSGKLARLTCSLVQTRTDVRYWHLADIGLCAAHVCFWPADIGKPTNSAFEPPTALRRRYLRPQMLPRHRMPSLPMDYRYIQSAPSRPHMTEGIVRVQESATELRG